MCVFIFSLGVFIGFTMFLLKDLVLFECLYWVFLLGLHRIFERSHWVF